ncbi:MAG TPA: tail fiber protein [Pyrinomonadaceae bacterium]|nr:tail fiber protein [Pyrinomonadaceae bacterium]
MAEAFVAEIRIFAGNFAPTGWALCNGQLMPISQNTALFSLLGTFYGGNGQSSFGLPNLQDSVPIHHGQGPGLTDRFLGESGGSESVTLLTTEIPVHNHFMRGHGQDDADLQAPNPNRSIARSKGGPNAYQTNSSANLVPMAFQSLSVTGSSLPHNNMQPYLAVTFIIALQGVFPPRT